MKLYTKRGDDGATDLLGGQRVSKASPRVEAYGSIDELNCVCGLAGTACDDETLRGVLTAAQSRLFEIGSELAAPGVREEPAQGSIIPCIIPDHIAQLEAWIDALDALLPPMHSFILPGGCELAARLHIARAVCRRAERACIALRQHEPVSEHLIVYLNRLSDLFFAMARRANQLAGIDDAPWVNPHRRRTTS